MDALIGYSGFVGSTLLRQRKFEALFRSTNIEEILGRSFKLVICCAAPAQKWIANREPEKDAQIIDGLIAHLGSIEADKFVLISTVNVFGSNADVDEETEVNTDGLHAYGYNRYRLEEFVLNRFAGSKVIRLPGLVGPGLRKNAIYDLKHNNNVSAIDSRSVFQFYPMVNLWSDIDTALKQDPSLFHFSAAPISMQEVARECFGLNFKQEVLSVPPLYNMRSIHAGLFGGVGGYMYSKRESLQAIRSYAQGFEFSLNESR